MSAQPNHEAKRARVTALYQNKQDLARVLNEKAERAVLGAVLQKPEIFPQLSHLLQATDFWWLFHGLVWYAVDKLVSAGTLVDILTVSDAIEREPSNPYKDSAQLIDAITSLLGAAPEVDNAEEYARQVREAAMKVRVLRVLYDTEDDILKGELHGEKLKDELNRRVFEATEQSTERKSDASSMMNNFIDGFEGGALASTVATGFHHLDALLGGHGFFPGEVAVLAGAEGMGKTTAALSMARNAARKGRKVVVFTMEMDQDEISRALITMETGISRTVLQTKRVSPVQYNYLVEAAGKIGAWDLHIVDMHEFPALKPLQLRRKLRSLMVNGQVDLVVLDGLWLMEADEPADRHMAVGHITRDLSNIAKQFQVPILVTHQYSADIKNADEPTKYHLAESAGVRRNAQVIIGLWRPSYFDSSASDETRAFLLKDRNRGARGSVPLPYDERLNRFGDADE